MTELLDWAYNKAGLLGVIILVETLAVLYLYRRRERDARDNKREQRKNLRYLLKLASTLRATQERTELPSHPYVPGQDEPDPDDDRFDDWEEPTVVTRQKQESTRARIQRLVNEYLANGHQNGKD